MKSQKGEMNSSNVYNIMPQGIFEREFYYRISFSLMLILQPMHSVSKE